MTVVSSGRFVVVAVTVDRIIAVTVCAVAATDRIGILLPSNLVG